MKLWIMSDLHVDIYRYQPPPVEADVVILAGDIAEGAEATEWIAQALPGRQVLFVPGNHEYYRLTVASGDALFAQTAATTDGKLVFMQQREWHHGGVRFLGCTLWTDFLLFGEAKRDAARQIASRVMADFSCINNESGGKFTVDDSIALNQTHLAWLTGKLNQPFDGPTVVITHHGPARPSLHAKYGDDPVSAGFINDLEHLMGKADLWIHGHTHTPFDYTLHGTRVVCNPRGYVTKRRGEENPAFNPALVIEL